jgi:magnesium-transporting ATPase (P-type)
MRKLFKGQQILSVLYILASIGMFLFALAFMTEYNDLFGLKLPQNQEIAMFHDVILQTFNRQIFAWSLVGVIGIALIVFLEILSCVPDRFALVVMLLLMIACCYGAANSIMNLQAISVYYQGLDFQYLSLEGLENYQLQFTTFRLGVVFNALYILVCGALAIDLTASHLTFVRLKKEGLAFFRLGCAGHSCDD